MSLVEFLDREREIEALDAVDGRAGPQFMALYGRRRIGKTALLLHWLRQRAPDRSAYWVAHRSTSKLLLAQFSRAVLPLLGTEDPEFSFSSWPAAFRELGRLARETRLVVAIDELPYLLESAPEFASMLQAVWDTELRQSQLRLIVAGSHYHMMHETFTSGRGPLFGRTTADLLLEEVEPHALRLFVPRYARDQRVQVYSIVGGVPKYLEMWDDRRPVLKNVEELTLSPVSIFRHEPSFLIQDEIAEPRTYLAILEAIGVAARRPVEIAERTGMALPHVGKYLETLRSLRFVRRVVSAEVAGRSDARKSRYEIRDPYLRFHFTFLQPNLHLLEAGRTGRLMELIRGSFDSYVGRTGYEELCRRHVARLADEHALPFEALHVGRMWSRAVEVDVAAIDGRSAVALLGECRFTRRKMSARVLDELRAKLDRLPKLRRFRVHFALFSRAGFTSALARRAEREGVLLFEGVPGLDE